MSNARRWYEVNEKLSILMSHLEKASYQKQRFIAEKLIKILNSKNIVVKDVPNEYIRNLRRRWYDNDEIVCLGIEHLKKAPLELQINLAEKLLSNMSKIDNAIHKKEQQNKE